VDGDGHDDLLSGSILYRNRLHFFEPERIGRIGERTGRLAVSDYDLDGDLDVFRVGIGENSLLRNEGGSFQRVDPTSVGLPAQA
jgi:hypothetical protein